MSAALILFNVCLSYLVFAASYAVALWVIEFHHYYSRRIL